MKLFDVDITLDELYVVESQDKLSFSERYAIGMLMTRYKHDVLHEEFYSENTLRVEARNWMEEYLPKWEAFARGYGRNEDPYAQTLNIRGKDVRWITAFDNWLYRDCGIRTTKPTWGEVSSLLGQIVARASKDSVIIRFTDDLQSWEEGNFADTGSCFFGDDRGDARKRMEDGGFLAIQMFHQDPEFERDSLDNTFEIDDETYYGIGRAWIIPHKGDRKLREFVTVFNGYCIQSYVDTDTRRFARIIATLLSQESGENFLIDSTRLHIDGQDSGLIYVNNNTGYVIHREANKVPLHVDYDLGINYYQQCANCDGTVEDSEFVTFEGELWCEQCADTHLITTVNGNLIHIEDSIRVQQGQQYPGVERIVYMHEADDSDAFEFCEQTCEYFYPEAIISHPDYSERWSIGAMAHNDFHLCKATGYHVHAEDMVSQHRSRFSDGENIGERTNIVNLITRFVQHDGCRLYNSTGTLFTDGTSLWYEGIRIAMWEKHLLNPAELGIFLSQRLLDRNLYFWNMYGTTGNRLIAMIDMVTNISVTNNTPLLSRQKNALRSLVYPGGRNQYVPYYNPPGV